jgi:hypothetical protein
MTLIRPSLVLRKALPFVLIGFWDMLLVVAATW